MLLWFFLWFFLWIGCFWLGDNSGAGLGYL